MNDSRAILVPLAAGFEETEAVAIIDVLRRAELPVVVAGLGTRLVRGAHGIAVEADRTLAELSADDLAAICLPGGMPGTRALAASEPLLELIRSLHAREALVAAVCAAPLALAAAGVLEGAAFTCHPSTAEELAPHGAASDARVVESGTLITSRGPGTVLEFSLRVVARLKGEEVAARLAEAMLIRL